MQHPLAATHGAVVGNRQRELHQLHHRNQEALRGPQTEMLDGFEDQGALNSEIRVDAWRTRPGSWLCMTPPYDRLFVKPYGKAAPVDQRAVVRAPIPDAIANHRVRIGHGSRITAWDKEGNMQQRYLGFPPSCAARSAWGAATPLHRSPRHRDCQSCSL